MARDIAAELNSFVTDAKKSFEKAYKEIAGEEISRFLNARMDQVRIYHALRASKALLETVRVREAFTFQDIVLKKERSRKIAYHSQRDHTCHTLNNFILGWYIYQNHASLKKSFSRAFTKRRLGVGKHDDVKFAAIWIYVSLLHDIGYIFEGDLSKPDAFKNEGIKTAIECLKKFFGSDFFAHNKLRDDDGNKLIAEGFIHKIDISPTSIEGLSDYLQSVGSLKMLLEAVNSSFARPVSKDDINNAFELWSENYVFFSNEKMSKKINQLRSDFQKLRTHGLSKDGPKILNHGVCSGLILLQCVTYYYLLYFAIASLKKTNTLTDIVERYESIPRDYSIDLWWSGLVWATAAVAVHDRYHALIEDKDGRDRLSFSDDPLAFLGILVDEMQLWDRFRVFDPTKGHESKEIPTQSSDVRLSVAKGRIMFSAPRYEIENLESSLDERLEDWREVVFLKAVN